MEKMYCNPLPLEHYQQGRIGVAGNGPQNFREMADPALLEFEGKYYLFPSAGMLWWSEDLVDWHFHPIEPFDPGYAPTVIRRGEFIYLSSSWDGSTVWRSRHPLGPWEALGEPGRDPDGNPTRLRDRHGRPVTWGDPCLFVDDDGAMYCYCNLMRATRPEDHHPWALHPDEGRIYAVRLDDEDPSCFASDPVLALELDPELVWQRGGEANQLRRFRVLEGAHLNKIQGRYYLQYSVNGTEYRNYAVGCAVGDSPLGPFRNQRRNPILIHRHGLINGTAHHSITAGPDGDLWCVYTVLFGNHHGFDRRIGMDPAGLDENGELFVNGPTETPQWAPGLRRHPERGNDAGLLPLSINCPVRADAAAPGRDARYAVDQNIRTWFQAPAPDTPAMLELNLLDEFQVQAARLIFADAGLDYGAGRVPGPYRWRLSGSTDAKNWELLYDASDNRREQHINFVQFEPRTARWIRLEILAVPPGFSAAVQDLTIFGR